MNDLPPTLQTVYAEVGACRIDPSSLGGLHEMWVRHVSSARDLLAGVRIEKDGETLILGDLSPGCRMCKEGRWECVFITPRCNLSCRFCCSPHEPSGRSAESVFGSTPEEVADYLEKAGITGISFSGGEALMEIEKLIRWLKCFENRWPDNYYWIYTNGLLANKDILLELADAGVDEVRFNMAATGYTDPVAMRNLEAAAEIIPAIAVEIPAIPGDSGRLFDAVPSWCDAGVKYLNLHELIHEPHSNSASMQGVRLTVAMPDGRKAWINPRSRRLTLEVMTFVQDRGLAVSVNDCSIQSKIRQLRGRRRTLGSFVKAPHERLVEDTFLESYCAYRDKDAHFFHPDDIAKIRAQYPRHKYVRLMRTAPLDLRSAGQWVTFEEL